MNKLRQILMISVLMEIFLPMRLLAQSFDAGTVEAIIDDHKRIRSALLVRSTVEQGNQLLHQYCKETDESYKEVNLNLDKYNRCFDIIDIIYSSATTVFNAMDTYQDVSERIRSYKELLEKYKEKCLERGNIVSSDTLLVTISYRTIRLVYEDGEQIIRSLYDLALYATGSVYCTNEDIMTIIETINASLDDIRKTVDRAYFELWKYITVRTGYWTRHVYHTKTLQEIADEAIDRWLQNAKGLDY